MRISDLLKLSTDNLRRRKGRTALTVIGVVVGTCAIIVMISLGIAANKRTEQTLASFSDLTRITVMGLSQSSDTPALDDEMIKKFKAIPDVVAATPTYSFQSFDGNIVTGTKGRYRLGYYQIRGMDPESLEPMGYELVSGKYLSPSSNAKPRKIPILVSEDIAYEFEDSSKSASSPKRYRWKQTDASGKAINEPFFNIKTAELTLEMITSYNDKGEPQVRKFPLEVVGIMKADFAKEGSTGIIMNVAHMKYLEKEYKKATKNSRGGGSVVIGGFGRKTGGYDQVFVKTSHVDNVESVEQAIKKIGYSTFSLTETRKNAQKEVLSSQLMLGGLAAISLLVAALNIANTMTMAIYERTKEIGVMKVLGCRIGKIREMFLIESATIGFIGGVIGVIFSLILSVILNHLTEISVFFTEILSSMGIQFNPPGAADAAGGFGAGIGGFGGGGFDAGVPGTELSIIPLWLIIAALLFATLVGVLSGLLPANRAVKISALEAIRHD